MANDKKVLLRHFKLLAVRCAAMVTGKISELTDAISEALIELDDAKQDKLTFDNTPTEGSANPVTSDGIAKSIAQITGASDNTFYAIYGTTTNTEIEVAYQAGKKIYCLAENGSICPLYERYSATIHCFYKGGYYFYCLNNDWTEEDCPYEGVANKVTSITEGSTDDQYPSAKAVYTAIDDHTHSEYVTTDTNYYHTPSATSGIKIATGTGVKDLYVPTGTSSTTVAAGNHTHSGYAPAYSYGTSDLDPEDDYLATGKLYFVYE